MIASNNIFDLLWLALPISFRVCIKAGKKLQETFRLEAPQVWESLEPAKGKLLGPEAKQLNPYLASKEYRELNNPKIKRAVLLAKGALIVFYISIFVIFFYYGFYFVRHLAQ